MFNAMGVKLSEHILKVQEHIPTRGMSDIDPNSKLLKYKKVGF